MTRKLPPLNAVRAFEAAARHVSFTKAAEELHVTHGAISRQVAQLEGWFGRALFRRTSSQVVLTDAGKAYVVEVTAALDRLAAASTTLKEQGQLSALRINAPPTFTMRWLITRMAGFQHRRADVEMRLTTSLAPVNFQDNSYDVAIRVGRPVPTGGRSVEFMTDALAPVCHPDLLQGQAQMSLDDLRKQTLLSYSTEPFGWNEWLAESGIAGFAPAGVLKFEQLYFALQAAAEGLGVVLLPLFLAIDDIVAGRLCVPFGFQGARQVKYYAVFPSTADTHPAAKDFLEWLQQEGRDTERSMAAWAESMGWQPKGA
jgi:LysR family transcriptional regulator, glycine cleavage system transcriptional activator